MLNSRKPAPGGHGPSNFDHAGRPDRKEDTLSEATFQQGPYPGGGPGHKGEGAGREAGEAFRSKVAGRRREAFDGLGDEPITADELAARIGRPTYITRPRLTELLAMGLVVKAEGRGTSEFGAPATLWRRATPEERALFNARKAVLDEKSGVDA